MREITKFYIDGKWVEAADPVLLDVINPATEQVAGHVAIGNAQDVDIAVTAARRAFADWSRTTVAERVDALNAIIAEYQKRMGDLAAAVTEEMGAMRINTAIARLIAFNNHLTGLQTVPRSAVEPLILMTAPVAILDHFEQVIALLLGQYVQAPIINDEQLGFCQLG